VSISAGASDPTSSSDRWHRSCSNNSSMTVAQFQLASPAESSCCMQQQLRTKLQQYLCRTSPASHMQRTCNSCDPHHPFLCMPCSLAATTAVYVMPAGVYAQVRQISRLRVSGVCQPQHSMQRIPRAARCTAQRQSNTPAVV
jgi:hypothetical protein